jgi:hypothetical protein
MVQGEVIQGGAEKREIVKLTMRFRPAVKFLLHVGSYLEKKA